MKDIFVVFVPAVCGLWLICVRDGEGRDRRAWIGVALQVAGVALLAIVYENMYRRATGDSFFDYYLRQRLGSSLGRVGTGAPSVVAVKIYNVIWYSARVLWFGSPGTFALLIAAARDTNVARPIAPRRELQALSFAGGAVVMYVAAMSLAGIKADRYIFPAYFIAGIAGACVAIRRWNSADRLAGRLSALEPYWIALAWLALFLVALPFELYVKYVKFWPS